MESVGNKQISIPAHHCSACGYNEEQYRGITYRQWLIGMIASDAYKFGSETEMTNDQTAESVIAQADAIIKLLDSEGKP